jgi:membrane protease YdiL (CAAX protease family)
MSTDVIAPGAHGAPGAPVGPPGPRTGAFADVRARWLLVWAVVGVGLLTGAATMVGEVLGAGVPEDLLGILLYLPIIAWVALMVVGRAGVDLGAMLRWPALGTYWFVVAGLLVAQFLFSLAAILVTTLLFPGLGDSLEGVGQGNVALAFLSLVVLPPLVEEVVFRGVLLERFTVKWRLGVAILLSAVLFGALHVDPVGAGMFGVITGLLYLRTGSLWPGILIHAVNNLVALVATWLGQPDADVPTPDAGETLVAAAGLLAISLPLLVWFIARTWPSRSTPTPYQRHEWQVGLPARRIRPVRWSAAPGPLDAVITSSRAVLSDAGGTPVAVLPLDRVQAAYASAVPGGQQVVILLRDGTWTTLHVPGDAPKPTARLALTVHERAEFATAHPALPPGDSRQV